MRISFAVGSASQNVMEMPVIARLAEEAGFEMVVTGDSPAIFPELYSALTLVAVNTKRPRIGSFVTNPLTRHPVVTASGIASVNAISGGRAFLGISTGDSGVYNLGMGAAKLSTLEEYIRTLRALWDEGEAVYRGRTVRFTWSRTRIPIYMSAGGPKSIRLAGRIADGVFIEAGLLPEVIADSLRHLEAGAKEAGRSVDDIDVWWYAKGNIADTAEKAAYDIRSGLASSANHTFRFTLEGKFVPPELHEPIQSLMAQYVFHQHVQPGEQVRNAQLVDELGLREYLMDRFGILGTPADWIARVEDLAKHGVRKIAIAALMPDKGAYLKTMGERVIPAFSG